MTETRRSIDAETAPGAVDGMSRRSILRGSAFVAGGVLLGGAAQVGMAGSALAAPEPSISSRSAWGARAPQNPAQVTSTRPTYIVVHHTATANSTDYSQSHAFALSRSIQNYHMDSNGWADTGQQLTISRGGHIMEGRNLSLSSIRGGRHVVGAHVANYNGVAVGIENEGTYTSVGPTTALYNSLVATCAWLCTVYSRPTSAIVGHRDLNATACPGNQLYARLPQLRSDVGARLTSIGLAELHDADLRTDERPPYPRTPDDEPFVRYDHGPALGSRDPNHAIG
ncbi:peptidoglycan recognition family protein [Nocardiopsis mangrovi]|uniref:Peptidoglycan recognition family protein n=1 Tax=Nocardiopsis mangrovi TaxID=1179818 RepID=A0ABV9E174_9ACTN